MRAKHNPDGSSGSTVAAPLATAVVGDDVEVTYKPIYGDGANETVTVAARVIDYDDSGRPILYDAANSQRVLRVASSGNRRRAVIHRATFSKHRLIDGQTPTYGVVMPTRDGDVVSGENAWANLGVVVGVRLLTGDERLEALNADREGPMWFDKPPEQRPFRALTDGLWLRLSDDRPLRYVHTHRAVFPFADAETDGGRA